MVSVSQCVASLQLTLSTASGNLFPMYSTVAINLMSAHLVSLCKSLPCLVLLGPYEMSTLGVLLQVLSIQHAKF